MELVLRGTISANCNTEIKKGNSNSSEVPERNSTNRRDNITCVTVLRQVLSPEANSLSHLHSQTLLETGAAAKS